MSVTLPRRMHHAASMAGVSKPSSGIGDDFRASVRAWLLDNCPSAMRDGKLSSEYRCWGGRRWTFTSLAQQQWLDIAADKGWTVPAWPPEYGGAGLSLAQRDTIADEMRELGIRPPLYSYGITMLGPTLLKYGTAGQKSAHLPDIARGKIRWCQGYSEPNAGSDLASLATRCEDGGDHWLINGHKIWTSKADQSDWLFAMVRTAKTERKHEGITFILIDMSLPGIEVRPIRLISGQSPFCEVFFSDVRVPKHYGPDNPAVVGELGQGWPIGMYLLTHERSSLGGYRLDGRGDEEPIVACAIREVGLDAGARLKDPVLRTRLADALIDDAACAALAEKLDADADAGVEIGAQSSLVKYASSQIIKRGYELRMSFAGHDALRCEADGAPSALARNWLYSRAYTILGGTSEIQLNVIAKRLLNLPTR